MKARVLAIYLPQYHPIKENSEWWGEGFTEWTNVGKARKMYPGHYQPKVPADLGYYDLRVSETRIAQANLAKNYGIEGFLYWHYWFGNGKKIMERPFNEVLKSGDPNFPFALAWANASWYGFDYGDNGRNILIEQKYPGEADYINHFHEVLPAFKDARYIKVDNKPFFLVYHPFELPDIAGFLKLWRRLAVEHNLNGIHFVAQTDQLHRIEELKGYGFDAVNPIRLYDAFGKSTSIVEKIVIKSLSFILRRSIYIKFYRNALKYWVGPEGGRTDCYPTIYPNWDHTPRSGFRGKVLHGSTPALFKKLCKQVFKQVLRKPDDRKIVILKSWNEWAEGNYIEPDLRFGRQYLEVLKESIDNIK
jgi:hypothetical protein